MVSNKNNGLEKLVKMAGFRVFASWLKIYSAVGKTEQIKKPHEGGGDNLLKSLIAVFWQIGGAGRC